MISEKQNSSFFGMLPGIRKYLVSEKTQQGEGQEFWERSHRIRSKWEQSPSVSVKGIITFQQKTSLLGFVQRIKAVSISAYQ